MDSLNTSALLYVMGIQCLKMTFWSIENGEIWSTMLISKLWLCHLGYAALNQ